MENRELEIWWSSLPVKEKERIARKGLGKQSADGRVNEDEVRYPACTRWWSSLDEENKKKIHAHCVARHGDELREWNEGNPYGD